MSMSYSSSSTVSGEAAAAYGGFIDALGGIATIVLSIIGLAGVRPEALVAIATVVFGAALLIQGGAMLSEFATIEQMPETNVGAGGGLSSLFLVGVAGIVLGILSLLGVATTILTACAVITFGAALLVSSSAVWHLLTAQSVATRFQSQSPMVRIVASEIAAGSSGLQAVVGVAVVVLGILAVAGVHMTTLTLIALLAAGAALVMTGSTLSGTLLGFMRSSSTAPAAATVQSRMG
jgi:hypothetical protein